MRERPPAELFGPLLRSRRVPPGGAARGAKDDLVAFALDDEARVRAHGAELIGDVAQYEDKYRLCYMRGPAGIIVALAEELF